MKRAYQLHLDGMAGVYAVAEQLCMRGHTPLFPSVDFGFDLALDNGLKIQVKFGRLRFSHPAYKSGAYVVDTRKGVTIVNQRITHKKRPYPYEQVADFVIFFGMDERRFFVIPASEYDGAAWIPPRNIAMQRTGSGRRQSSISKMGNNAKIVHFYEDAWHLLDIDSTLHNLEMADAVADAERVEK